MKKRFKNANGITLIALVVTIVVLLILAGISINAVLGNNGLISRTKDAKEKTEQDQVNTEKAINSLVDEMEAILENGGSTQTPDGPTIKPLEETTVPSNWDSSKVKAIISEDDVTVPVPIGYTYSMIDGERSVANGFVIKEGTDGSETSGVNEFVWVPVPEISDLYDETNNAGQLWDFGTSSSPKNLAEKQAYPTTLNSGYREPDVVTGAGSGKDSASGSGCDNGEDNSTNIKYLDQAGFDTTDANNNLDKSEDGAVTASDFKIQLQNEFTAMKNSVEKYGGFYIGRYETGNLSKSTAVVQKGNRDINNQNWYTLYKVSKTIKANDNVVSSMIWGSQWDATLRWMQNYGTSDKVKNFPTDTSLTYGNYFENSITYVENGTSKTKTANSIAIIPTGCAEITNINNIYDMAGNVGDWTLEAHELSSFRTLRGGDCGKRDYDRPASLRHRQLYVC